MEVQPFVPEECASLGASEEYQFDLRIVRQTSACETHGPCHLVVQAKQNYPFERNGAVPLVHCELHVRGMQARSKWISNAQSLAKPI